jgi:GTP-binding protein EngB required for normal cell division
MGHGVEDFDPPPDHENKSLKLARDLAEKEKELQKLAKEHAEKEKEHLKRAEEHAEKAKELEHAREHAEKEKERAEKERAEKEKERAEKENELLKHARKLADKEKEHQHAKELADKDKELLDKENKQLKRAKELMDKESEELKRAKELADQENERLKQELSDIGNGIESEFMPTAEEIEEAERRINYQKDKLHIAIAGVAGTGKSSLINALRCVRNATSHAAKIGTTETTLDIGRYPDPATELPFSRFVWYDIPGAGTQTVSARTYTKDQLLYIFDVVVLVIGSRFMDSDAEVLKHCRNLKVPTVIVRSRADEQVRNIEQMREQAEDDDDEEGERSWLKLPWDEFIDDTKDSIARELRKKGLPDQHVHIVSSGGVYQIAAYLRGKRFRQWPIQLFDEKSFVEEVMIETYKRRYRTQNVDFDEVRSRHTGAWRAVIGSVGLGARD